MGLTRCEGAVDEEVRLMKLRDLMTSTVYTIGSEQSSVNSAAQMRELSVG
jgi:hypothetical protein